MASERQGVRLLLPSFRRCGNGIRSSTTVNRLEGAQHSASDVTEWTVYLREKHLEGLRCDGSTSKCIATSLLAASGGVRVLLHMTHCAQSITVLKAKNIRTCSLRTRLLST
jgi:hypothetical protein